MEQVEEQPNKKKQKNKSKWLDPINITFTTIMLILLIITILLIGERQEVIDQCNQHWLRNLPQEKTQYIINYTAQTNQQNLTYEFKPKINR